MMGGRTDSASIGIGEGEASWETLSTVRLELSMLLRLVLAVILVDLVRNGVLSVVLCRERVSSGVKRRGTSEVPTVAGRVSIGIGREVLVRPDIHVQVHVHHVHVAELLLLRFVEIHRR